MDRCGLTQEQAARKLGKSRSALANILRLLTLPDSVLELLKSGFITIGHAKVVLGLPTPELQAEAAQMIADNQLNAVSYTHLPEGRQAAARGQAGSVGERRQPHPAQQGYHHGGYCRILIFSYTQRGVQSFGAARPFCAAYFFFWRFVVEYTVFICEQGGEKMQHSTIAAIATAPGAGGIAVVRLSGPESYEVAERVFRPANPSKKVAEAKGYTAMFGAFVEGEDAFDEGVALFFRAPHSYTGEDVVELSCHGGSAVARRLVDCLLYTSSSSMGSRWDTSVMVLLGTMMRMSLTAVRGRSTMARR